MHCFLDVSATLLMSDLEYGWVNIPMEASQDFRLNFKLCCFLYFRLVIGKQPMNWHFKAHISVLIIWSRPIISTLIYAPLLSWRDLAQLMMQSSKLLAMVDGLNKMEFVAIIGVPLESIFLELFLKKQFKSNLKGIIFWVARIIRDHLDKPSNITELYSLIYWISWEEIMIFEDIKFLTFILRKWWGVGWAVCWKGFFGTAGVLLASPSCCESLRRASFRCPYLITIIKHSLTHNHFISFSMHNTSYSCGRLRPFAEWSNLSLIEWNGRSLHRLLFKFWFMFGLNQQAKVPNSSQYDFKGASVTHYRCRLNRLLALTSLPPLAQAMWALLPTEEQAGLSPIRVEASAINWQTRQMSWKAPNTGQLSQPRTPTILRRTSRKWRRKLMHCLRNALPWRSRVSECLCRTASGRTREGKGSYK